MTTKLEFHPRTSKMFELILFSLRSASRILIKPLDRNESKQHQYFHMRAYSRAANTNYDEDKTLGSDEQIFRRNKKWNMSLSVRHIFRLRYRFRKKKHKMIPALYGNCRARQRVSSSFVCRCCVWEFALLVVGSWEG